MSRKSNDFMAQVKEYFINSTFTLKELSERSEELFGSFVSYDVLKKASQLDNWLTLRADNLPENLEDEITNVRKMLYQDIMAPSTSAASRAQLVNAWSNLLSRSKVNGTITSAKTTTERALEIKGEALVEVMDDLVEDE